jgi:hypothetical protein
MDDNNLLMIVLAFVFGYCLQGMMKNMCGRTLIEGACDIGGQCGDDEDCFCDDGIGNNAHECSGNIWNKFWNIGECASKD